MKMIYVLLLSFAMNSLFANEMEIRSNDSMYEMKDTELKEAQDLLDQFEKEVSAYLQYRYDSINQIEVDLKESKRWEDALYEVEELKKGVEKMHSMFLDFRLHVSNLISLNYGYNQYGSKMYSLSMQEMTKWYIQFLEKMFLPRSWKSYLQETQKS